MKSNFLFSFLIAAMFLSGCAEKYDSPKTGDLVFVGYPAGTLSGSGSMAEAISSSTGKGKLEFVHTAILEVTDSGDFVIDATIKYGVDRHPLDTLIRQFMLKDGTMPTLVYMRLKDDPTPEKYVENSKAFIGEGYDLYFLPDNGLHYCTELVYDSYIKDGEHLFSCSPMNFKDAEGNMPQYWTNLFDRLGQKVPQDVDGTNPESMSESPALVRVKPQGRHWLTQGSFRQEQGK